MGAAGQAASLWSLVFRVSRQLRKAPVRCSKVNMELEAGTL